VELMMREFVGFIGFLIFSFCFSGSFSWGRDENKGNICPQMLPEAKRPIKTGVFDGLKICFLPKIGGEKHVGGRSSADKGDGVQPGGESEKAGGGFSCAG
jgi:hypothetical protein